MDLNLRMIANFYKALGDPVRLQMLSLMRNEWRSGADLARLLKLSQATVSYHLSKLNAYSILEESRWGREVNYRLSASSFRYFASEAARWVCEGEKEAETEPLFLANGRLESWPKTSSLQYKALAHIMKDLCPDTIYSVPEMEQFMAEKYEDTFILILQAMQRWMLVRVEGGYLVQPEECWRK